MIFFTHSKLLIATAKYCDEIEDLAKTLGPNQNYFKEAIANKDTQIMNDLIDETIMAYTGSENIIFGLEQYCKKFDLPLSGTEVDDMDYLQLIYDNKEKIAARLKEYGL